MAKRGVPLNPGYRPGSHWAICDYCGFQFRSEDLREDWQGFWACDEDFERRHPQDFLRVKEEKIAADQPLRPEDTSNVIDVSFINVNTRNISNMTYDSVSLDLSATTSGALHPAVTFSTDGTKLYAVASSGLQPVWQFNLSTAWDLSTASYSGNSYSSGLSPFAIRFKPDGTKLFIIIQNGTITDYTLSTPWDISTAAPTGNSFNIGAETVPVTITARDFSFNGDGTRLYYIDSTNNPDGVYLLNLSTAYDITTISFGQFQPVNTTLGVNPSGLFYTNNEKFALWLTESGADTIVEYTFPDLDDITTINKTDNTYTLQTGTPAVTSLQGVFIADDKLYAYGNEEVHQFTLPARLGRAIDTVPAGTNDNTL